MLSFRVRGHLHPNGSSVRTASPPCAGQATRGRPAFAVVLEAAQARDDLAGRTSSLPQPDPAAGLSRPSLQTVHSRRKFRNDDSVLSIPHHSICARLQQVELSSET